MACLVKCCLCMCISHNKKSLPFWHGYVLTLFLVSLFVQDNCGGEYCFKLSNLPATSHGGSPEILYVQFIVSLIKTFRRNFSNTFDHIENKLPFFSASWPSMQ